MRIVLIGVSGCGKTAVGKALATKLGIPFYDGDLFHPEANKEKMAHGIPLTDEDRRPFLEALAKLLKEESSLVLACSALKESYRKALRVAPDICFIYLKGSPELIRKRLEARKGHFFDPKLLDSQFEALKEPTYAIVVDASPLGSIAYRFLSPEDGNCSPKLDGDSSLNSIRYQRLRGKITLIKGELVKNDIEETVRLQLKSAKSHFKTHAKIFEKG